MTLKINNPLINEILSESVGKEHISVIKKLSQPKYDEDIASELGLKATIIRTLLNDLHSKGLVEYDRIKNKSTGWYTYIWRKREDKLKEYILNYLNDKIEKLNEQLESEKNDIFKCSCMIVSLEKALESDFFCPNCNEQFIKFDNSSNIKKIKKEIEKAKKAFSKL